MQGKDLEGENEPRKTQKRERVNLPKKVQRVQEYFFRLLDFSLPD